MNLNSNRLLIGHVERRDLEQWFLIESDPEVRKYILDGSILNREQSLDQNQKRLRQTKLRRLRLRARLYWTHHTDCMCAVLVRRPEA